MMRDSPIHSSYDQSDAIINRINLQLARSRSILNSWRPQNQPADEEGEENDDLPDNDEDFKSLGEKGGIDSKAIDDDDSLLPTRRSATKDKLLEQLIGKKAANAKRKEEAQAYKSTAASKFAALKPAKNQAKQVGRSEESEDEGQGRAGAFRSKKPSNPQSRPEQIHESSAREDDTGANVENDELIPTTVAKPSKSISKDTDSASPEPRPQKRKGGSYLDELLSQKANKKSKKKKQQQQAA